MTRFPTVDERRKRTRLEQGLSKGKVLVHLDPRHSDVEVPEAFRNDPALALNFSHQFPFANTTVGPFSIDAFLSFGGERFQCSIPYGSVFCVTEVASNDVTWFPESLPQEIQAVLNDTTTADEGIAEQVGPTDVDEADVETKIDSDGGPTRSRLTLVK